MNYASIQLTNYPEVLIAGFAALEDNANYLISVPDFPDLHYTGWSFTVPKDRVLQVNYTTEIMATAYLRATLPVKPDLNRRDWRGKAHLKIQIGDLESAYKSYATGKTNPMPRGEFVEKMEQFLKGNL